MLFKGTAYLYVGEGRNRVCSYRGVTLHAGTHTRTCTHTYAGQHTIQFTVGSRSRFGLPHVDCDVLQSLLYLMNTDHACTDTRKHAIHAHEISFPPPDDSNCYHRHDCVKFSTPNIQYIHMEKETTQT